MCVFPQKRQVCVCIKKEMCVFAQKERGVCVLHKEREVCVCLCEKVGVDKRVHLLSGEVRRVATALKVVKEVQEVEDE